MTREFKKSFFSSLLAVLLVISNLLCAKYTHLFDLTIGVQFLTYPFTFLCTLLIYNLSGKKGAYQSIVIASMIQIFILISYSIGVNLGTQSVISDIASSVNKVFAVDQLKYIASLLAFLVSHYVLIYIYENFKSINKELYGTVIGLLGGMFLNSILFTGLTLYNHELLFIVNLLLSNVIINIVMVVLVTILFFVLNEKNKEVVEIKSMNIKVNTSKDNDKTIEELLETKAEVKTTKSNTRKSNTRTGSNTRGRNTRTNSRTNTRKNTSSRNNTAKKNTTKKANSDNK